MKNTILENIKNTMATQVKGAFAIDKKLIDTTVEEAMKLLATECNGWTMIYEEENYLTIEW